MKPNTSILNRRGFLKKSSIAYVGGGALLALSSNACAQSPQIQVSNSINVIGPKEGYTPQIGTLVSMLNWMRNTILWPVRDLGIKDLDYLHDATSNSIGAMLLHLAATERFLPDPYL